MKRTKRFISGLSALAIAAALAPMSAFAENETGSTDVSYIVTPSYTVNIPAGVTLDSDNSVSANIEASDVIIESGKKIKVSLTGASNTDSGSSFSAKTEKGDSTATYTIGKGEATTGISIGDVVAEFTADGTQALTFSKAEGATHAGTHTETLTFGISVETEVNVSSIKIMYDGRDLTEITVNVDETIALTAETDPEGATVTWSSSDPSIATVDQNGVVRGVGMGSVSIEAAAGGKTATCELMVVG